MRGLDTEGPLRRLTASCWCRGLYCPGRAIFVHGPGDVRLVPRGSRHFRAAVQPSSCAHVGCREGESCCSLLIRLLIWPLVGLQSMLAAGGPRWTRLQIVVRVALRQDFSFALRTRFHRGIMALIVPVVRFSGGRGCRVCTACGPWVTREGPRIQILPFCSSRSASSSHPSEGGGGTVLGSDPSAHLGNPPRYSMMALS